MTKKDLQELKRAFNLSNDFLELKAVTTAFVDKDRNIRYTDTSNAFTLSDEKLEIIMDSLKGVLGGSLGKNFTRYGFPRREYETDGAQNILFAAADSADFDKDSLPIIERIANDMAYCGQYAVILGKFDYRLCITDSSTYSFIIGAVCPMESLENLLEFDESKEELTQFSNPASCISRTPSDGFLFPVFADRSPDVNGFMYYCKNPKYPNISFIEDVMGCKFYMTSEAEKDAFISVISEAVGNVLDYRTAVELNTQLLDFISLSEKEKEPPAVTAEVLCGILDKCGVDRSRLNELPSIFARKAGSGGSLQASSLANKKINIKTSDISVTASCSADDLIRTDIINGKPCIVIELTEPSVTVNDLDIIINKGI
ncbi:MAG: DUF4317 domain-containing protein [Ruminococcus sp.]|nr:DUF4317 domain-containing protein [Ruminococcus sp.]